MKTPAILLVQLVLIFAMSDVMALEQLLDRPPMHTAASWVLMDAETGRVLESLDPDSRQEAASLTKIMSAVLVLDYLADHPERLQTMVKVSADAARAPGTSALLEEGDRVSIENLMYGMLLPSGNDAATALAEYVGRRYKHPGMTSIAAFVDEMNNKAVTFGLLNTRFVDVHGMGENYSTPLELGLLTRIAMNNPVFRKIVDTRDKAVTVRSDKGASRELLWINTNQLLDDFTGVKTGYTNSAGGCLILSGVYRQRELYLVVMGSANKKARFIDGYNLFQWSLQRLRLGLETSPAIDVPFSGGH